MTDLPFEISFAEQGYRDSHTPLARACASYCLAVMQVNMGLGVKVMPRERDPGERRCPGVVDLTDARAFVANQAEHFRWLLSGSPPRFRTSVEWSTERNGFVIDVWEVF